MYDNFINKKLNGLILSLQFILKFIYHKILTKTHKITVSLRALLEYRLRTHCQRIKNKNNNLNKNIHMNMPPIRIM